MENTTEKINETAHDEAFKMLIEKGFSFQDRMKIRKAFSDWGKGFDDTIERSHKHDCYTTKKSHYGFHTEQEAKFFNSLKDLSPEANDEKIIQVMSIVTKLLDIESSYSFTSKK